MIRAIQIAPSPDVVHVARSRFARKVLSVRMSRLIFKLKMYNEYVFVIKL